MKLGILVVYKLTDELLPLLEIHLERIRRHTTVPYTIHGAAVGLSDPLRHRLAAEPCLQLSDLPPTADWGGLEHTWYLQQLTDLAFEQGATHVLTLHLDSFPVADHWVETLAASLSPACPIVTIQGGNTACLLMARDFYEASRPRYMLSAEQLASRDCQQYLRTHRLKAHSGAGLLYAAHRAGLSCHIVLESTANRSAVWKGQVFGQLVMHWGGVVRVGPTDTTGAGLLPVWLSRCVRALLPDTARRFLRRLLSPLIGRVLSSRQRANREAWIAGAWARLLAEPDAFIDEMSGLTQVRPDTDR